MYYLQSRYYDPVIGRFINADVYVSTGQGILGNNMFAYCGNNPVTYADPSGNFAVSTLLIGLCISSLVGWAASEVLGEQIAGGVSSAVNGGTAIYTGINLLSFGPVGWVAGGGLILVGAATMAFGINEVVDGATGENYIKNATGMSSSLYSGLYTGLNIASSVGTIAGNGFMRYANTSGRSNPGRTGKPLSRYSTLDDQGVKQYRFFNSNGDAWYDVDFRHGGNMDFPHYHSWESGSRNIDHWSFIELLKWIFGR